MPMHQPKRIDTPRTVTVHGWGPRGRHDGAVLPAIAWVSVLGCPSERSSGCRRDVHQGVSTGRLLNVSACWCLVRALCGRWGFERALVGLRVMG